MKKIFITFLILQAVLALGFFAGTGDVLAQQNSIPGPVPPTTCVGGVCPDYSTGIPVPVDSGVVKQLCFLGICMTYGIAGQMTASGLILAVINVLLGIAGLLAVLFVIIGGFRYITSAGNEEMAEAGKRTLLHAILGIVIVILSFVVIRVISTALIGK